MGFLTLCKKGLKTPKNVRPPAEAVDPHRDDFALQAHPILSSPPPRPTRWGGGDHDAGELQNRQKWTALVPYIILDTKIFIQLQKSRKLWIKIKRRMKLWLLNHAFLKFFPLNRTRWGSYRHPLHALSSSKEGPWTLLSIALLGARIGHRLAHYPIAQRCQKIACPHGYRLPK